MGCLYKIDFPNGKSYVGISSSTAEKRFAMHCLPSNKAVVGRAIRKHSKNRLKLITLVLANDWGYLCELEKKAIRVFGTRSPFGYNMTDGGDGVFGMVHSEQAKAAISNKNKVSMKGKIHSDATRKKISANRSGIAPTLTTEQRAAKRALMVGNKHCLGHRHTDEARAKIAAAGGGRTLSEDARSRISAARKGNPLSNEHCAKLSASHTGKVSGNKGVAWSEETRAKHAARHATKKEAA